MRGKNLVDFFAFIFLPFFLIVSWEKVCEILTSCKSFQPSKTSNCFAQKSSKQLKQISSDC